MNVTVFGYLILINIAFYNFSFNLRFLLSFSFDWEDNYIKHSRQFLTTFPNTSKFIKNTPLCVVFSTPSSVFRNVVKHGLTCNLKSRIFAQDLWYNLWLSHYNIAWYLEAFLLILFCLHFLGFVSFERGSLQSVFGQKLWNLVPWHNKNRFTCIYPLFFIFKLWIFPYCAGHSPITWAMYFFSYRHVPLI